MRNIYILRKTLFVVFLVLAVSGNVHSGNIIIKPGRFDHFAMQMPEKVRAGEGFIVRLQAYDTHDNLITDFGDAGKDFKVSVSGSAQIQPSLIKSSSFMNGSVGITITDKKAETITLSIFESGGSVPVLTKEITVLPNKLDHFSLQAPQAVTAGNNFDVKIIAKDAFDNSVADADIEGKNLKVSSSGTTNFKIISSSPVFRAGVSIATIMAEKTGEVSVEVHDTGTGSKGRSSGINVTPAGLDHFKVYAPKEAVAGEHFEITISAFDAFDNLIDNYSSYGNGVNITTTGQEKPLPSYLSPSEFRNGQATSKLKYEKAEEIGIIVTENNKSQQGRSTSVKISPSAPDNFVVITPEAAVAGQRFRIKIEAYDRFNNIVRNYNLIGNDVYLNTTGTGMLSPKIVATSEFVDGLATADVLYDKAESFTISAAMTSKREEKKIAMKEQKEEARVSETFKAAEKPSVAEIHKAQEKPEKRLITTREERASVKKAEKKEPPKEKKPKEKAFEIKKISLIEAKNKAMVIVNMKASKIDLEYRSRTESSDGKDWIVLNLKPVVNKARKSWKFKSAFIGGVDIVDIMEDKASGDVVELKVELLSKNSNFEINRVKNSLVISISNP
ncbi:MAG: hypothetical protein HY755_06510 [Nitrospirae bacterium]|nr:hypothetical protein [Nitrospirota bacterium]